jgi:hypothetical protein
MHRKCLLLLGLSLALFVAVPTVHAANAAKLSPEQAEEAKTWIRQLGDRSFKAREAATKKLMDLGRAGIDSEVRRRSERLLELAQRSDTEVALALYMAKKDDSLILKLPSYDRFSKTVGKDDPSKKLFVDMYCAEGTMLAELDRDPKGFSTKFTAHCQKLQQSLYTPWGQANPLPHHQVLALLFMATDSHVSKDVQTFYMMNNMFYQPSVKQGFQDNAGSRKLLISFLESRNNQQTSQQIFYIAKQMGLKEAVPMALKVLEDKTANQYARGMAVLFVGQMGGKDHRKDLEKLLEDKTAIGSVNVGVGGRINAQMRDVALAALILSSGQNVYDYSFPYMQNFRGYRGGDLNLPPYYYGFSDDKGREEALKKWKDSQAAEEKKK